MSDTSVPFLDIPREIESLREPLTYAIQRVLSGCRFILGPEVNAFEEEAAEALGVRHAIGVNSGTDALVIALRAMGVEQGDEVVTTPFTFISTAESISLVGATPVFADIDLATFNLDPERLPEAIGERTKAIMPVHLFGQTADIDAVRALAEERGIGILEDAAQAFGATGGGVSAGGMGTAAAFSFYPTKNLGGCGDGGLITTDDDDCAERARMLRGHGSKGRGEHQIVGYNSRLDELQAAVLRVKLPLLESWNEARRRHAARYDAALAGRSDVSTPAVREGCKHVYHQYTIRVTDGRRDAVRERLTEMGIGTMVYYDKPLHRLPVYAAGDSSRCAGELTQTERAAAEVLSLPVSATMTDAEGERVVAALQAALDG